MSRRTFTDPEIFPLGTTSRFFIFRKRVQHVLGGFCIVFNNWKCMKIGKDVFWPIWGVQSCQLSQFWRKAYDFRVEMRGPVSTLRSVVDERNCSPMTSNHDCWCNGGQFLDLCQIQQGPKSLDFKLVSRRTYNIHRYKRNSPGNQFCIFSLQGIGPICAWGFNIIFHHWNAKMYFVWC